MMNFNFKNSELQAIRIIAETRSISITAERIGITQTNMSRMLSAIERKTGFQIFDRTSRPLSLTTFGAEFLPIIINQLDSHEKLVSFIEGFKQEPEGEVRVHAPAALLILFVKHVLPQLNESYPDIKITMIDTSLGTDGYIKGSDYPLACDLLLTHSLPHDEDLVVRKVCTFEAGIYSTSDFLLQHPINNLSDYEASTCIQFNFIHNAGNPWLFQEKASGDTVTIMTNGKLCCDNLAVALTVSAAGFGYVFSPGCALELL